jgi:DNA-binding NarL/FixJ family response regulator
MSKREKIHLVLADDQVLFVESLKRVMDGLADDIIVDAIAQNGQEAIALVEKHQPNIVLMDVRMPQMDGVEATKAINDLFPDIQVIMLTTFDDDEYVQEAIQNGAVGYLLKDIPPEELIAAIRAVRSGCFLISPCIARKLISRTLGNTSETVSSTQNPFPESLFPLNRREKELLSSIALGLSNKEIAARLFLAEQTVKNRLSEIYAKLGVNNRFQLLKVLTEGMHQSAQPKANSIE